MILHYHSNTYDFYETPQRVSFTTENNTEDVLDFTTDALETPQTANNETAENIEINITNINTINNCGVEKQVSPTPIDTFGF